MKPARAAAYANIRTYDPAPCGEPYRGEAPDPHKDRRGRSPLLTGQVPSECKVSSYSRNDGFRKTTGNRTVIAGQ